MTFRTIAPFLLLLATACTTSPTPTRHPAPAEGTAWRSPRHRSATRTALTRTDDRPLVARRPHRALGARRRVVRTSAQTFGLYAPTGASTRRPTCRPRSRPCPRAATAIMLLVYPVPASVSGTQVTYRLRPLTQHGTYDGACDIMHAATRAPRSTRTPTSPCRSTLRHPCHAVRIEIPAGRNLLGRPVKTPLEITFPRPVARRPHVRCGLPVARTGARERHPHPRALDLPGTGMTDAEGVYAWAFIAPRTDRRRHRIPRLPTRAATRPAPSPHPRAHARSGPHDATCR